MDTRLGRRSWVFDGVLAAMLATAGVSGGLSGNYGDGVPPAVAAAFMAAAGAAQAGRRIVPLTACTVTFAALGVLALIVGPYQAGESLLIGLVAAYSGVAYGSNRAFVLATLVAYAAVRNVGQPPENAVWDLAFTLPALGLAAAAGMAVRALRERATSSAQQAASLLLEREEAEARGAEQERRLLARELHDILAHGLGTIVLQSGAAEHALASDPARARTAIGAVRITAQEAVAELNALVRAVRADVAEGRSPQPTLADLPRLAERSTTSAFRVELDVVGPPRPVPPAVEASVYRVAQEGVSNAMRYSGASGCRLVLSYAEDEVRIAVVDDGGPDGRPDRAGSGHGLVGARERADVLGGWMSAGPRSGGGWELAAGFPTAR